jgi:hypothetical protein
VILSILASLPPHNSPLSSRQKTTIDKVISHIGLSVLELQAHETSMNNPEYKSFYNEKSSRVLWIDRTMAIDATKEKKLEISFELGSNILWDGIHVSHDREENHDELIIVRNHHMLGRIELIFKSKGGNEEVLQFDEGKFIRPNPILNIPNFYIAKTTEKLPSNRPSMLEVVTSVGAEQMVILQESIEIAKNVLDKTANHDEIETHNQAILGDEYYRYFFLELMENSDFKTDLTQQQHELINKAICYKQLRLDDEKEHESHLANPFYQYHFEQKLRRTHQAIFYECRVCVFDRTTDQMVSLGDNGQLQVAQYDINWPELSEEYPQFPFSVQGQDRETFIVAEDSVVPGLTIILVYSNYEIFNFFVNTRSPNDHRLNLQTVNWGMNPHQSDDRKAFFDHLLMQDSSLSNDQLSKSQKNLMLDYLSENQPAIDIYLLHKQMLKNAGYQSYIDQFAQRLSSLNLSTMVYDETQRMLVKFDSIKFPGEFLIGTFRIRLATRSGLTPYLIKENQAALFIRVKDSLIPGQVLITEFRRDQSTGGFVEKKTIVVYYSNFLDYADPVHPVSSILAHHVSKESPREIDGRMKAVSSLPVSDIKHVRLKLKMNRLLCGGTLTKKDMSNHARLMLISPKYQAVFLAKKKRVLSFENGAMIILDQTKNNMVDVGQNPINHVDYFTLSGTKVLYVRKHRMIHEFNSVPLIRSNLKHEDYIIIKDVPGKRYVAIETWLTGNHDRPDSISYVNLDLVNRYENLNEGVDELYIPTPYSP